MSGGLLNLIAVGIANSFLTGNPTKTFFKIAYSQYTNFGMQKFRLDYDGIRTLNLTQQSQFTFKVKRYGDLLMDTYLVFTLPDIYSPIMNPCDNTNNTWVPYEFRWIRNIGTQIIKQVEVFCGTQRIQSYSGYYLESMISRDFPVDKKDVIDRMSGNIADLYDPANANSRANAYPNSYCPLNPEYKAPSGVFQSSSNYVTEPSIRGRLVYVPLNLWFCLNSNCAFPLIATPFAEISITITLRPVQELFQVQNVYDIANNAPYIQPDFNQEHLRMYRFLQSPPHDVTHPENYPNTTCTWNTDVHLIATYAFLADDERKVFSSESQVYLVKDVCEYSHLNVVGSKRLALDSNGMVSNWMILMQRNDVNQRNEWSNYSNWAYSLSQPNNITFPPFEAPDPSPMFQPDGSTTGFMVSGPYSQYNQKNIMQTMAVVLDGTYRENDFESGVFSYIEQLARTSGQDALYCYNFGLSTDPFTNQPSGAINMNFFRTIEIEVTTYLPPLNQNGVNTEVMCLQGVAVGLVSKPSWNLYEYGYNVLVMEERFNVLSFSGGSCGLQFCR